MLFLVTASESTIISKQKVSLEIIIYETHQTLSHLLAFEHAICSPWNTIPHTNSCSFFSPGLSCLLFQEGFPDFLGPVLWASSTTALTEVCAPPPKVTLVLYRLHHWTASSMREDHGLTGPQPLPGTGPHRAGGTQ